jgi:hypothetical protein
MEGFLGDATKLNALLIRYEDLVAGNAQLEEIEAYLNIRINRTVLKDKVGSSERDGENAKVSWLEKQLLKRAVSPLAQKIGYKW